MTTSHETARATPTPTPVDTVMGLALAYLVSRSLHVAAQLGIADLVKDQPRSVAELAAQTGAHRASLYRLLRTLAAHGVFAEDEQGRFATTPAAALLQQGALRDGILLCGEVTGDGSWWHAVGALRHSVMSGEPAFERQHGVGFFDYLAQHPQCARWFDRGMANFASAENRAIAEACGLAQFAHVVDVGGGQGGLLAELLQKHPGSRGTLFDLPAVVRNPVYLNHTVPSGRWAALGGDFFQSVPAGADVYILKRILHDWSDEQCVRLLRCCRAAMSARARLLVADAVLPEGNVAHPGKVMDILMMVFAGGRERTEKEFGELFAQSDLRLVRVMPTRSALSIVEAVTA